MALSKLPLIVSVLSLLVAVASIWMLFSVRTPDSNGNRRLSAASYVDEVASEPPVAIDQAVIAYSQTAHFAVDFKKATALALDADDRIYIAGDKAFCRYSPLGSLEMRISLNDEPACLTVGNRQHMAPGRVYVGYLDHVEVYDANGVETKIWQGLGPRARFSAISSSEHYIFIADAGQNLVQRFDWEGKLLDPFGDSSSPHFSGPVNGGNAPFDLAVGLDDLVYATDRRDHRIEGYDYQGSFKRHWGNASPAVEDFAGANNPAHLAITPSDSFVTAEENPLRVKIYSRSGEFQHVVCGSEGTGSVVAVAGDSRGRILVLDGKTPCVRIFEAKKPAAGKRK
jgi:hypothetical protein